MSSTKLDRIVKVTRYNVKKSHFSKPASNDVLCGDLQEMQPSHSNHYEQVSLSRTQMLYKCISTYSQTSQLRGTWHKQLEVRRGITVVSFTHKHADWPMTSAVPCEADQSDDCRRNAAG